MSEYRFELPGEQATNGWEAVSKEAQDALSGPAEARQILTPPEQPMFHTDIEKWVKDDLNFWAWNRYAQKLGIEIPLKLSELDDMSIGLEDNLIRLSEQLAQLKTSNALTGDGEMRLADSFHLQLVPWGAFLNHWNQIGGPWLGRLREAQAIEVDLRSPRLMEAIRTEVPFYRNPDNPDGKWLSVRDYTRKQLDTYGEWGVMLVQTGASTGEALLDAKTPDQVTGSEASPLAYNDVPVDAVGILEWIAISLQSIPVSNLGLRQVTWLPANRFFDGEKVGVPNVMFGGSRFAMQYKESDTTDEEFSYRLGIM